MMLYQLFYGCSGPEDLLPTPPPEDQPAEVWAATPAWPQLVLTNHATFRGGQRMLGASSFLARINGEVLLATALHLTGPAGGVEPEVPLSRIDAELREWSAFVRMRPQPSVIARGVAMDTLTDNAHDWLVLRLQTGEPLPSAPLTLRTSPVAVGERIWLVGCEYRDTDCTQSLVGGRVTARRRASFRYTLDEPTVLNGFSGAPVLDTRGLVVGVMSVWFNPKMNGDEYLEGGGQDASALLPLLTAR